MGKSVVTLVTNRIISFPVMMLYDALRCILCHRHQFSCDLEQRTAADWGNSKLACRHSWKLFHPAADKA